MNRFSRAILGLLLALSLLAPVNAQQFRQPPQYRILISNDDGVKAPGLAAIAQIVQAIGTPIIVAPAENQTGKGHSVVTTEPVFRQDFTLANGLPAIGLTATPATAVSIAIRNIVVPRPDLVISGINHGVNLGYSAYVSGTAGAAREAVLHGIPAIAASMFATATAADIVLAAEEVFGVARRVKQFGLPPNTFLNVNVPAVPADRYKGYMVTTQARVRGGQERFAEMKHPSGRTVYWSVFDETKTDPQPQGTDVWAIQNGYTSVTPMVIGEGAVDVAAEGVPAQLDRLRAIFK